MGDVVHYSADKNYLITICNKSAEYVGISTSNIKDVTCPDCLEKLGVEVEVDEEKVEFAKALVSKSEDETGSCLYCREWTEIDYHEEGCVVLSAEAYLKSVKGDSDE